MLAEEGCRQRGWCVEREELWRGWVSFAGGGLLGRRWEGMLGGGLYSKKVSVAIVWFSGECA